MDFIVKYDIYNIILAVFNSNYNSCDLIYILYSFIISLLISLFVYKNYFIKYFD